MGHCHLWPSSRGEWHLGPPKSKLLLAAGYVHRRFWSYLREGAVIPEVTLVRETIANETELSLLYVLLDRVEKLLLRDLIERTGQ
jgi:hypothetical protein